MARSDSISLFHAAGRCFRVCDLSLLLLGGYSVTSYARYVRFNAHFYMVLYIYIYGEVFSRSRSLSEARLRFDRFF